jgi:hypothetical protein
VLASLSNVVTASANRRLLAAGSYGRARGLLQKAGLAPGKVGADEKLLHQKCCLHQDSHLLSFK